MMMMHISNLTGTLDVTVGDAIVNGYRWVLHLCHDDKYDDDDDDDDDDSMQR